ncbi:MAG: SURF1 family protein [Micropepsaceae bacterium]
MTFRPLPILTMLTLLSLAILIALGTWQLERREQKHALIAQIEARAKSPPAPVEIVLATGDDFAAQRQATALGTFNHAKEVYVYAPRTDGGPTRQGKKVVTPFALASGGTILVDRGWVNEAWPSTDKSLPEPEGEVEIEGVLRPSSRHSTFTPPTDTTKRMLYIRDSAEIAKIAGVTPKSRLIFEATKRIGNPEPLKSSRAIPDNHLNYALTWFSLALVLLVIYLRYHYVRGRLKFSR